MTTHHEMQAQRYELKYIISEELALPIRAYISTQLVLDAYSAKAANYSYPIHSIYFDSADLHTYHATTNGDRNRFKIRLRYYDGKADSPVFFELKKRSDDVIYKDRCMVPRHAIQQTLAGDDSLVRAKEKKGFVSFLQHVNRFQAKPKAYVSYFREAWMSPKDNSVRVTLDRQVHVEPYFSTEPTVKLNKPVVVFGSNVVLELKFTNRYPEWFRGLVQHFHLMQSGGPKYSGGVLKYGEKHFQGAESAVSPKRSAEPKAAQTTQDLAEKPFFGLAPFHSPSS